MKADDLQKVSTLKRIGYVRAANTAPVLRAHGFNVVMARTQTSYHNRGTRWRTKVVPWAPGYAVRLVRKLRGLDLGPEVRKEVLAEALRLGKPGPIADAAFVAGRIMR